MSNWIHCNYCYLSSAKDKYYVTNCTHIICEKCKSAGREGVCLVCKHECNMILLTPDLSPDMQMYFHDPTIALRKVINGIEFQNRNWTKFSTHLQQELNLFKQYKEKYNHAKEYIAKLKRMMEDLQKDNKQMRNVLKSATRPPSASFPSPSVGAKPPPLSSSSRGSMMQATPMPPPKGNNPSNCIMRGNSGGLSNSTTQRSGFGNQQMNSGRLTLPTPSRIMQSPHFQPELRTPMSSTMRSMTNMSMGSVQPSYNYPRNFNSSSNLLNLSSMRLHSGGSYPGRK